MPTLLQDLFSRHPVAGERPQAVLPIPYGERPTDFRWNSDPLDFDGGYGGSEMDAGYFVLPYWMVTSARCSRYGLVAQYSASLLVPTLVAGTLPPLHQKLGVAQATSPYVVSPVHATIISRPHITLTSKFFPRCSQLY
jgi:hypothetical protein